MFLYKEITYTSEFFFSDRKIKNTSKDPINSGINGIALGNPVSTKVLFCFFIMTSDFIVRTSCT